MEIKKLKIAITGNIGSGKTVFCNYVQKKGFTVIYADDIAKDVLKNDPDVKKKIIGEFGSDSYNIDGLNIEYLAEKVFDDEQKVKKINSIVHPPTINKINNLLNENLNSKDMVFCEAALIYEANMEDLFDYIILITTSDTNRFKRLLERDGVEEEEIQRRLENQIADEEKKHLADFVFENNTTLIDLENKAEFLINLLQTLGN